MLFHVRMTDYPVSRRSDEVRAKHWKYFADHAQHFHARGMTRSDDGKRPLASVIYVDFPDRAALDHFLANEPNTQAGVYMHTEVFRWGNATGRRQTDFQRKPGQVYWYMRGYAKPGAHEQRQSLFKAHQAYFEPYNAEHFIVRGGAQSEDGSQWVGSANLIALPDRAAAEAFAAEEPFCKNGLFERMLIERYDFGGAPAA